MPEDVDAIAAMSDGAARNRAITSGYFTLARALAEWTGGPGANWCVFAGWASRQAGRTIRGEDLAVAFHRRLSERQVLRTVLRELAGEFGIDRDRLQREIADAVLRLPAARRAAEAVARGNVKVFEEIGRDVASLLRLRRDAPALGEPEIRAFCEALPPGPPPDGRDLLAAAFLCFWRASREPDDRAQWILLANLQIGLHEQTRLQPEILASLNAAALEPGELEAVVLRVLSAHARPGGSLRRVRLAARRTASEVIAREARDLLRLLITNRLMTIELASGELLHLGEDIRRPYPPSLATLVNADLQRLVAELDPTPDSTRLSGARDWSDLADRMHFIGELFRTYQEEPGLVEPPPDL